MLLVAEGLSFLRCARVRRNRAIDVFARDHVALTALAMSVMYDLRDGAELWLDLEHQGNGCSAPQSRPPVTTRTFAFSAVPTARPAHLASSKSQS